MRWWFRETRCRPTTRRNIGEGDFSVAAWIHPKQLQKAGIVESGELRTCAGLVSGTAGHARHAALPDGGSDGWRPGRGGGDPVLSTVSTPPGTIRANEWQHVAAVVRRGRNETLLYVNGYLVAKGQMGAAQFDDEKADLQIGNIPGVGSLSGRTGGRAAVQPASGRGGDSGLGATGQGVREGSAGKATGPGRRQQQPEVTLKLGDRQFSGGLTAAGVPGGAARSGPLPVSAKYGGMKELDRIVLTPLPDESRSWRRRFLTFEKRSPRVGVHLGLRRDCGSTFARSVRRRR